MDLIRDNITLCFDKSAVQNVLNERIRLQISKPGRGIETFRALIKKEVDMNKEVLQKKKEKKETIIKGLMNLLSELQEVDRDIGDLYEEKQSFKEMLEGLQENMETQYQKTVDKQQELLREKEKKILDLDGSWRSAEKERDNLREQLASVNSEKRDLESMRDSLLTEKEALITGRAQEIEKREKLEQELAVAKADIQALKKEYDKLSTEKSGLEDGLKAAGEEKQKTEEKLKKANIEKEALRREMEGARQELQKTEELRKPLEIYKKCRNWSDNDKVILNIRDSDFTTFLFECREKMVVFYGNAEKVVKKKEASGESIERLNEIIDCCIELNRKTKGRERLRRQEVRVGDEYDERFHKKSEDNPYDGIITRVHFQGILNGEKTFEGCRAYVEIENSDEHD